MPKGRKLNLSLSKVKIKIVNSASKVPDDDNDPSCTQEDGTKPELPSSPDPLALGRNAYVDRRVENSDIHYL